MTNIQINLSKDQFKFWLQDIGYLFMAFDKHTLDKNDPKKHRIFIDNNSDILLIAHLDTVQKPKLHKYGKHKISASGLDDRLGALIAYQLSKILKTDLLLTDLEESCQSTAQYHECKEYNWIAEFDRCGNDTVTYDLDCPEFRDAIDGHFKSGIGSFSDICMLDTESCCVNIGIGYELAHNKNSYARLDITRSQVTSFLKFYTKHRDTKFIQNFKEPKYDRYDYSGFAEWDECELCGNAYGESIYGRIICESCFEYMYGQSIDGSF